MTLTKKQKQNALVLCESLEKSQICKPELNIAILCVFMKESGGRLVRTERSYKNTSNERILKVFGKKKLGAYYKHDEALLSILKQDTELFFNWVYRDVAGNRGFKSGDGYRYRGRGPNQLTGLNNYKRCSPPGYDLVVNPQEMTKPSVAAAAFIRFFELEIGARKKHIMKRYGFEPWESPIDLREAVRLACNINAGWGKQKDSKTVNRAFDHAWKHAADMEAVYNEYWMERMNEDE